MDLSTITNRLEPVLYGFALSKVFGDPRIFEAVATSEILLSTWDLTNGAVQQAIPLRSRPLRSYASPLIATPALFLASKKCGLEHLNVFFALSAVIQIATSASAYRSELRRACGASLRGRVSKPSAPPIQVRRSVIQMGRPAASAA